MQKLSIFLLAFTAFCMIAVDGTNKRQADTNPEADKQTSSSSGAPSKEFSQRMSLLSQTDAAANLQLYFSKKNPPKKRKHTKKPAPIKNNNTETTISSGSSNPSNEFTMTQTDRAEESYPDESYRENELPVSPNFQKFLDEISKENFPISKEHEFLDKSYADETYRENEIPGTSNFQKFLDEFSNENFQISEEREFPETSYADESYRENEFPGTAAQRNEWLNEMDKELAALLQEYPAPLPPAPAPIDVESYKIPQSDPVDDLQEHLFGQLPENSFKLPPVKLSESDLKSFHSRVYTTSDNATNQ